MLSFDMILNWQVSLKENQVHEASSLMIINVCLDSDHDKSCKFEIKKQATFESFNVRICLFFFSNTEILNSVILVSKNHFLFYRISWLSIMGLRSIDSGSTLQTLPQVLFSQEAILIQWNMWWSLVQCWSSFYRSGKMSRSKNYYIRMYIQKFI